MQPRLRPRRAEREAPVYRLSSAPRVEPAAEHMTGVLVMGGSAPDTRLIDVEPLARAYRRVLHDSRGSVLRYGDAAGHPRLRSALAAMLASTRGLTVGADQIFVTRGSQMALSLVARSILRRGDVVAVEALGYRHAWQAFRLAGARLLPVLVDAGGLDVAALARCAEQQRIAAVYVTPHHQFPTTVTLTQDRRQNLLELARRKGIAIIEDDYDHEFHYEGPSVMPLASLGGTATVIYVGTLSKILAPGLRIGYVAAAAELLERLAAYRAFADMQGDFVVEGAVAELMETGEVQRHVRRVRLEYRRRRDLLADRLRARLGHALSLERPSGGLAVWASSRPGTDIDRWAAAALDHGVAFQTAHTFTFSGERLPHARLGYGTLNEMEIVETVERLAAAHVAVTPG
jgi:GntR family transcriptional regulator/MocR family aminotransferase